MSKYDVLVKKTTNNKFFLFLLPFFLILLGDGILSYIFPIVLENHVSSNFLTGLIMSLSSVVGILCDFLIPIVFAKSTWKIQLIIGIVLALMFPLATAVGDIFSIVWMFILAVVIWGIYFEFLMFSQQSFIVEEEKPQYYSHDWGIIEFLTNIVLILAPVIGALVLEMGALMYGSVIMAVEGIALILTLVLIITRKDIPSSHPKSTIKQYVDTVKELKYWEILSRKVYIVLVMAVVVEIICATFQVFAGLYGEQIIKNQDWTWLVLGMANIPALFGSLFISKLNISKGKKRFSQLAFTIGGLILSFVYFFNGNLTPILIIIFISNLIVSVCWPLDDAIFSDLQERLREKDIYLIGLSQAAYSIAYIIAPSIMGFIADRVGYNSMFSFLGIFAFVIGIILLIVTPKKLRLPQKELSKV